MRSKKNRSEKLWVCENGRLNQLEPNLPLTVVGPSSIFEKIFQIMAEKPQPVALKDYMYCTRTTQPSCITLPATNATFELKSNLI